MMEDPLLDQIISICRDLNSQLEREEMRPEEVQKRISLLEPLEKAVAGLPSPPEDLDGVAGHIAQSLWHKNHPQEVDLDRLTFFLTDSSAMVRFTAAEAIANMLEFRAGQSAQTLPIDVKQVLVERQKLETSPLVLYHLDRIIKLTEKTGRSRRQLRPKLVKNPYVAGTPVRGEEFFGRRDIIEKVEKFLMQMGTKGIVMYGARRTGKTSVLLKIRDGALGPDFFCVYVDMQAFSGVSLDTFVVGFLQMIEGAVRQQRAKLAEELPSIQGNATGLLLLRGYLKELLVRLKPASLVLMLDEYVVLGDIQAMSELARQFQNLLETEENLCVILAGAQKVEALKQKQLFTLLDTFKYLKLSFLDRKDAIDLIRKPARGTLEFSNEAVDEILTLTGGHPFYVQLICQSLFDIVISAQEQEVAAKHIERAVELFLRNPSPHLVLSWNALTSAQEMTGVALANLQQKNGGNVSPNEIFKWLRQQESPLALRPSEVEHSLEALRDIDWVEKQPQENAYRLTMELVRRWILENRSIRDLAEKYCENVLAKVPGCWRQTGAAFIDFVIFTVFVWLTLPAIEMSGSNGIVAIAFLALVYMVIPILFRSSTLGMAFCQLRVVRASSRPLGKGLALIYGLMLGFRYFVFVAFVGVVLRWFSITPSLLMFLQITMPVLVALELAQILMILFSKRRRGGYDRFFGTILVPAAIARE